MTWPKPLTYADLKEIQTWRDAADVLPLLWEIKRLQAIALRAHQLQDALGQHYNYGAVGIILGALRDELKAEPCVIDRLASDAELFKRR